MAVKDYRISNLYYILAFALKIDKVIDKKTGTYNDEQFDNIYDLYSVFLIMLLPKLVKMGLYKDYVEVEEKRIFPKGKIIVSATLKEKLINKQNIVCSYDDYTSNTLLNRIIKSILFYLLKSKNVSDKYKKDLKKIYFYFNEIENIDLRNIEWKKIVVNRYNKNYKTIINICYLIYKNIIISENEGIDNLFESQETLDVLFERFVREYYIRYYPQLNPRKVHMKWNIDEGYPMLDFIQDLETDINLYNENKTLIIDTKFYANILSKSYYGDKKKIDRDNWNQIYVYVVNESYRNKDRIVYGMLLYAQTDEEYSGKNETSVMGHSLSLNTLDLRKKFSDISGQLDKIADNFINL